MTFIHSMLSNFNKIKIYNPLHDFIAYFVPTYVVVMYGLFANYEVVHDAFAMTSSYHTTIKVLVALILFTAIGKLLYEVTAHTLSTIHILTARASYKLRKKEGFMGKVGRLLGIFVPHISEHEVAPTKLHTYFAENPIAKAWYARIRMSAFAFQTALGSLGLAFFIYDRHRAFILATFLIVLILAISARSTLAHTESELEESLSGKG